MVRSKRDSELKDGWNGRRARRGCFRRIMEKWCLGNGNDSVTELLYSNNEITKSKEEEIVIIEGVFCDNGQEANQS